MKGLRLTTRGTVVVIILSYLLVFACFAIGQSLKHGRLADEQGTIAPLTCVEDDPCWDCKTMGNGVCGP